MDFFSGKRLTKLVIIILVILNVSTLTMLWVQHYRNKAYSKLPPPRRGPEKIQRFLERELSLSPEQARRFRKLRQDLASKGIKIQNQVHQLKSEIMEELFAPDFDRSKVNHFASDIGKKQAKLEILVFDHFQDLKKVLSPDQRKKFQLLVHDLLIMIKESSQPRPDSTPLRHKGPPPDRNHLPG